MFAFSFPLISPITDLEDLGDRLGSTTTSAAVTALDPECTSARSTLDEKLVLKKLSMSGRVVEADASDVVGDDGVGSAVPL